MCPHATPGGAVARRSSLRTVSHPDARHRSTATRLSTSLIVVACLALIACDANSTIFAIDRSTPDPWSLADAELFLLEGVSQEGEVAALLPEPLVVEVRDPAGDPFADAPIEWVFQQGRGAPQGLDL